MQKFHHIWPYIKRFKMNSIFLRTFLLVSLMTIVPFLILSIIFYSNHFKSVREDISRENSSTLDSSVSIIDRTLMECDMMSSSIASNESTQMFAINGISTDSFVNITGLAKTLPVIYKYIDSVYIYIEPSASVIEGDYTMPLSDFTDKDWLDSYRLINNQRGLIIPRSKRNSYPPLITIIKPIYVANEKKGAVVMNINSQIMYSSMLYKRYKDGRLFFFINNEDKIIMASDADYLHLQAKDIGISGSPSSDCKINGERYSTLVSDSIVSDYTYVSAYPRVIYERQISAMQMQIVIMLLILLGIVFILAYIVSIKSYSPLQEIISSLDESNTSLDSMGFEDKDELMYIIDRIRSHIEDKTRMEDILDERMKLLRQTQYDMLQIQINPHFLYNTLETINWMAYNMSNSENPVSKSLVNLASFFRNTVSAGYFVTVESEIKHTKEYINILSLRYGDLFDIEWDIDESILPCTIIKICLQPIVENAIYHGIKPKNSNGLIKITGRCEDNNIILTVSDNGIGMDEESLQSLNQKLSDSTYNHEKSHIGLANVNKRIKIIFGDNYGISVESRSGAGTDVHVIIPRD